jgi:hypothetical protein
MWRGHDDRLAEQAYRDRESDLWRRLRAGETRGPILGESARGALAAEELLEREEPTNQADIDANEL